MSTIQDYLRACPIRPPAKMENFLLSLPGWTKDQIWGGRHKADRVVKTTVGNLRIEIQRKMRAATTGICGSVADVR